MNIYLIEHMVGPGLWEVLDVVSEPKLVHKILKEYSIIYGKQRDGGQLWYWRFGEDKVVRMRKKAVRNE